MVKGKIYLFGSLLNFMLIGGWLLLYLMHDHYQFDLGRWFTYFRSYHFAVKLICSLLLFLSTMIMFFHLIKLPEKYQLNGSMVLGIFGILSGIIFSLALLLGKFMSQ